MTAKITPNGIKVKSIRTGPTGDKIIPQNSNKNCEYNLNPNINDDKKRFDFLQ